MTEDLDIIDPTFIDDLINSHSTVEFAALWLASAGIEVYVNEQRIRPSVGKRMEWSDNGDIRIKVGNKMRRLEVKGRTLDFTSLEDFPFRHGIIVDVVHTWDRAPKDDKPLAYLNFNKDKSVCIVVPGKSHIYWKKELLPSRGRKRWHYICPLEHCELREIDL